MLIIQVQRIKAAEKCPCQTQRWREDKGGEPWRLQRAGYRRGLVRAGRRELSSPRRAPPVGWRDWPSPAAAAAAAHSCLEEPHLARCSNHRPTSATSCRHTPTQVLTHRRAASATRSRPHDPRPATPPATHTFPLFQSQLDEWWSMSEFFASGSQRSSFERSE